MYIESVPNRNSPPAILLRESYREGGKVKKRTLLNLSDWPRERIAGFKALLKGGTRRSSTALSTGWRSARRRSRRRWPGAISAAARWCSTM